MPSQSFQAVIKHHKLGGLSTGEIYFSQFWRLRNPRSGHQRFNIWWEPTFWFVDSSHFALSSQGSKGSRDLSGASFIRVLIAFKRSPPSGPSHLKALPPDTTLGIRFQHRIFGERTHLVHSKCLPMNKLAVTLFTDFRENSIASYTTCMTSWMQWHQARWFCSSFIWPVLCAACFTQVWWWSQPGSWEECWGSCLGQEGSLEDAKSTSSPVGPTGWPVATHTVFSLCSRLGTVPFSAGLPRVVLVTGSLICQLHGSLVW